MNGLLDPEYWRAVNERLVGLLGPQMERLNEVGGLLSGTLTAQEFMGKRAEQVKQSMTPDEMMGNFAGTGLLGTIKKAAKLHKTTGLPLNPDGTVTVYHATTKEGAEKILQEGRLRAAAEPRVYVSSSKSLPEYGDGTIVALDVNPKTLILDDEFPSGRRDFSILLDRPGGEIAVKTKRLTKPE